VIEELKISKALLSKRNSDTAGEIGAGVSGSPRATPFPLALTGFRLGLGHLVGFRKRGDMREIPAPDQPGEFASSIGTPF
jgi:hypothetical protein